MTRQHFNRLAAELLWARPTPHAEYIGWEHAVQAVADACAIFNPNFDRSRFLHAAGVVAPPPAPAFEVIGYVSPTAL